MRRNLVYLSYRSTYLDLKQLLLTSNHASYPLVDAPGRCPSHMTGTWQRNKICLYTVTLYVTDLGAQQYDIIKRLHYRIMVMCWSCVGHVTPHTAFIFSGLTPRPNPLSYSCVLLVHECVVTELRLSHDSHMIAMCLSSLSLSLFRFSHSDWFTFTAQSYCHAGRSHEGCP